MNITWKVSQFQDLLLNELYEILKARMQVFVVEQNCYYLDMDGEDQNASHIQGFVDNKLVAYCRVFPRGTHYSEAAAIGRVLIDKDYRRHKLAQNMISLALDIVDTQWREHSIDISAQTYLLDFYASFGFVAVGEEYLDAGIPHRTMQRRI